MDEHAAVVIPAGRFDKVETVVEMMEEILLRRILGVDKVYSESRAMLLNGNCME